MKKIPTLFEREFANHRVVEVKDKITPGCEDAFLYGAATIKLDGCCCAIMGGKAFRRYDAKKGKKPPAGAIPCCAPDPVTGHHPHWVPVDPQKADDKWFAKLMLPKLHLLPDGTYEAVGGHFNGNPYNFAGDQLMPHGMVEVDVERTYAGVKAWLECHNEEGLVFWYNGEPVCKIKRSDFGLDWPTKL